MVAQGWLACQVMHRPIITFTQQGALMAAPMVWRIYCMMIQQYFQLLLVRVTSRCCTKCTQVDDPGSWKVEQHLFGMHTHIHTHAFESYEYSVLLWYEPATYVQSGKLNAGQVIDKLCASTWDNLAHACNTVALMQIYKFHINVPSASCCDTRRV